MRVAPCLATLTAVIATPTIPLASAGIELAHGRLRAATMETRR